MAKRTDLSRRAFLAKTATGFASAGFLTGLPAAAFAQATHATETTISSRKIIHRTLGRTGLSIPIVSMGVMNADNPEIVQASYEIGVRHFDTAASYQYGRNEQMVGRVIEHLAVRDKVIIATKISSGSQRGETETGEIVSKLVTDCEASLKRLNTDYVDILYIHSVDSAETVNNPANAEGLNKLKEQKKIRFAGVSTHTRMADVINAVAENSAFDVVLTAINFTMAGDGELLGAIDRASARGVGVVAMKTQAGGARWPNPQTRKKFSSATISTAALKWAMRNESITTSIPGYTNYEHMQQDFSVVHSLEYTDEERAFLDDNEVTLGIGFCRQCRQCLASCPRGVDIPNLMRTHMYTAQYANFHQARMTLNEIPAGRGLSACGSCDDCIARCANNVDIPGRVAELKLVYG